MIITIQNTLVWTTTKYPHKLVLDTFGQNMAKVFDLLSGAALNPSYLTEAEINRFVNRVLAVEFEHPHITLDNLRCGDRQLQIGNRAVRCISMVNTDSVDLPEKVGSFGYWHT